MHVCVHACVCVHAYVHVYIYMYVCTLAHVHVSIVCAVSLSLSSPALVAQLVEHTVSWVRIPPRAIITENDWLFWVYTFALLICTCIYGSKHGKQQSSKTAVYPFILALFEQSGLKAVEAILILAGGAVGFFLAA